MSRGNCSKQIAQGYKKQDNEILSSALEKNDEEVPCTNSFTGEDEDFSVSNHFNQYSFCSTICKRNAIIDDIDTMTSEFSENDLKVYTTISRPKSNEDMNGKISYQPQDERSVTSNSNDNFQKVAKSIIRKVERIALIIDDINFRKLFLCHSDIMDFHLASKFTEKISKAI
ncbi:14274_t:CDS:2 [Funneliformis caledonium]|uniref:14274_t:CDS:1 n=1 Tax=Funneliformis caledonium TaxID=1117310 RepID=A0A9N9H154_9GLOM|nr:14274_t:CDS:2 [Funneliformis caledonium]